MIKVLVIDDDFMVAKVHAGFVRQAPGFAVVGAAHTGASALEAIRTAARPGPAGHPPSRHQRARPAPPVARRRHPELDVLVISARPRSGHRAQGPAGRHRPLPHEAVLRGGPARPAGALPAGLPTADRIQQPRRTIRRRPHLRRRQQPSSRCPEGCSMETLQRVVELLRSSPSDLSATEAATRLGTSRVSARRYLEYLNEVGRVEIRLRYGAGRPERGYAWLPIQAPRNHPRPPGTVTPADKSLSTGCRNT